MANDKTGAANELVAVTGWNACYNSGDGVIALSCTVTTNDSSAAISGVGLMLNNSQGSTLASSYTELSNDCESVNPALNILPAGLNVGDMAGEWCPGKLGASTTFSNKSWWSKTASNQWQGAVAELSQR